MATRQSTPKLKTPLTHSVNNTVVSSIETHALATPITNQETNNFREEITTELITPIIEQEASTLRQALVSSSFTTPMLLPSVNGTYADPYDPDSIRFINNKYVYTCTGLCCAFDSALAPYQTQLLLSPVNINGTLATTVEQALHMINTARTQVNVDWDASSGITAICNKPILASVATLGTYSSLIDKPDFADVAYSGCYCDLYGLPTIPAAQVNSDWLATEGVARICNKPSLSCVACSGDYNDLCNKPDLCLIQQQSDWAQSDNCCPTYIRHKPELARVATSGLYADLLGAPVISEQVNSDWLALSGPAYICNKPSLSEVALSGDYNDLRNIPPDTSKTYTFSFDESTHKLAVTEHGLFGDTVIFNDTIDTAYSFEYECNTLTITDNRNNIYTVSLGTDFYTKGEVDCLICAITDLIPEQASVTNQLADKNFVNSSIATNTANFCGTFNNLACLCATVATPNDYAFYAHCDTCGNCVYDRYKYNSSCVWVCEYTLNNSSFTANQWAAINSGITDTAVAKITDVYNCTVKLCNADGTALLGSFTLNQNQNTCICLDVGGGTVTGINVYCGSSCVCTIDNNTALCLSSNAFNTYAQINTATYPGACCTGTLVASDLNGYATCSWVTGKGYTTCKGTVTQVKVGTAAYNPSSGIITLPAYPPDLSNCAGLDCTGNVDASSLATVATSGKYCDLTGKPTIPAAANNGKITLCVGSTCVCSFTVNQSTNTNITLPAYPPDLSSCAGLDCTGNVSSGSFNGKDGTVSNGCLSFTNVDFNYICNASNESVTAGTTTRKAIVTNMITNVGYITRASIGLYRRSQWGTLLLSLGIKDDGTCWTDYCFCCDGTISSSKCGTAQDIHIVGYSDNATCFSSYTYADACADIRSGLTDCTGTVTILDAPKANSNVPVALCTGETSVGKSASCAINFNTCTGLLSVPRISNSGYSQKWQQTINLSSQSTSCFYPVLWSSGCTYETDIEIQSPTGPGSMAYNQNYIHFYERASGWNDTPKTVYVQTLSRFDGNENVFGCIGYGTGSSSYSVIWLRGGMNYIVNANVALTAHAENVTCGTTGRSPSTYTVGTSLCGGTNTCVEVFANATTNAGTFSNQNTYGTFYNRDGCAYILKCDIDNCGFVDHDCLVKLGEVSSNADRAILQTGNGFTAGCTCPVYFANVSGKKFTYNAACGLLKIGPIVAKTSASVTPSSGADLGLGYMELSACTPFIDFHRNHACQDFSSRIIDGANGLCVTVNNATGCTASTTSCTFCFLPTGVFKSPYDICSTNIRATSALEALNFYNMTQVHGTQPDAAACCPNITFVLRCRYNSGTSASPTWSLSERCVIMCGSDGGLYAAHKGCSCLNWHGIVTCQCNYSLTANTIYYIKVGRLLDGFMTGTTELDIMASGSSLVDKVNIKWLGGCANDAANVNGIEINATNWASLKGLLGIGWVRTGSNWNCANDIYIKVCAPATATYCFGLNRTLLSGAGYAWSTCFFCTTTAPTFTCFVCTKPDGAKAFHWTNGTLCVGTVCSCDGILTTCTGTVTGITLGSSACTPDTNGNITLPAYPPDLSSCAGLTCTGTVTISNDSATECPIALCTGANSVGRSTGCPLTYNPATGTLCTALLCVTDGLNMAIICATCYNTLPISCQFTYKTGYTTCVLIGCIPYSETCLYSTLYVEFNLKISASIYNAGYICIQPAELAGTNKDMITYANTHACVTMACCFGIINYSYSSSSHALYLYVYNCAGSDITACLNVYIHRLPNGHATNANCCWQTCMCLAGCTSGIPSSIINTTYATIRTVNYSCQYNLYNMYIPNISASVIHTNVICSENTNCINYICNLHVDCLCAGNLQINANCCIFTRAVIACMLCACRVTTCFDCNISSLLTLSVSCGNGQGQYSIGCWYIMCAFTHNNTAHIYIGQCTNYATNYTLCCNYIAFTITSKCASCTNNTWFYRFKCTCPDVEMTVNRNIGGNEANLIIRCLCVHSTGCNIYLCVCHMGCNSCCNIIHIKSTFLSYGDVTV